MNSRRLLLHIGPHKTGSTAIQIALANALEADERSFATLERLGGAHQVAELFSGGHFDEGASLLSEIPKAPATVVLSSENFSRLEENQIASEPPRFLRRLISSDHAALADRCCS